MRTTPHGRCLGFVSCNLRWRHLQRCIPWELNAADYFVLAMLIMSSIEAEIHTVQGIRPERHKQEVRRSIYIGLAVTDALAAAPSAAHILSLLLRFVSHPQVALLGARTAGVLCLFRRRRRVRWTLGWTVGPRGDHAIRCGIVALADPPPPRVSE